MKKTIYDPYLEIIKRFNIQKVKYVVIGVAGINYYAKNAMEMFITGDFDIFIQPSEKNLLKSIKIIKKMGFDIIYNTKKVDKFDTTKLQQFVKNKKPIICIDHFYGFVIELCLEVSGYTFDQIYSNAETFIAERIKIKVAKLSDLLKMKELAGREKDVMFLKKFNLLFNNKHKPRCPLKTRS